jgi:hypothetical protein
MEAALSHDARVSSETASDAPSDTLRCERYGRHWAVWDGAELVCVAVYRKGAVSVIARLRMLMEAAYGCR